MGQPLIYAMTLFISLGVFLVRCVEPNTGAVQTTDPSHSLVMIRGSRLPQLSRKTELTELISVMSGIITGPFFKEYFNEPGAGELGLMVSVLEIGALSTLSKISLARRNPLIPF